MLAEFWLWLEKTELINFIMVLFMWSPYYIKNITGTETIKTFVFCFKKILWKSILSVTLWGIHLQIHMDSFAGFGLFNDKFLLTLNYHWQYVTNYKVSQVLIKASIKSETIGAFLCSCTSANYYPKLLEFIKLHISSQIGNIYLKYEFSPFIYH